MASLAAGTTYGSAKGASITSVRIADQTGCSDSGAFYHAIEDFVLGDYTTHFPAVMVIAYSFDAESESIDTEVEAAISAGITVVVSAGNNQNDDSDLSPQDVSGAMVVRRPRSRRCEVERVIDRIECDVVCAGDQPHWSRQQER